MMAVSLLRLEISLANPRGMEERGISQKYRGGSSPISYGLLKSRLERGYV